MLYYVSAPPSKTMSPVFAKGAATSAAMVGSFSSTWAVIAAVPYLYEYQYFIQYSRNDATYNILSLNGFKDK